MNIQTESYSQSVERLPKSGQTIIGCQDNEHIIVYQAYNNQIADYAVQNQVFGGSSFSYNRMSWIKPNFLWMMYRCGWASKENQERVLAIWMRKSDFDNVLREAVFSSFHPDYYETREDWKSELEQKEVRLQWDPDHDPFGVKLQRRAIQLGMKGMQLEAFGKQLVQRIEDITEFVREQKVRVDSRSLDKLAVPVETFYNISDDGLRRKVGVEEPS